jgi:hypothetical protein
MTESLYEGVERVIQINTNSGRSCPVCRAVTIGGDEFELGINHLLQEHGGRLLHVGTQSEGGDDGKPWHFPCAVVGFEVDPLAGAL